MQAAWSDMQGPVLAGFLEARKSGVGIARHGFKEMRDGVAAVGRKNTAIPFMELAERAPAALDTLDNQKTTPLLQRLLCGPEGYDYDYYMGELRCNNQSCLIVPPDKDAAGYTYWYLLVDSRTTWSFICLSFRSFISG